MNGEKAFGCLGSAHALDAGHLPGVHSRESGFVGNEGRVFSNDIKGFSTAHPFHSLL